MRQNSVDITGKAKIVRWTLFILGGVLSAKYILGHWIVGPAFAIVILGWRVQSFREVLAVRSVGFLIAATLTYALLNHTARFIIRVGGEVLGPSILVVFLLIPFCVGAMGSLLLPIAHAIILKAPWKRALVAIPAIFITWSVIGLGGSVLVELLLGALNFPFSELRFELRVLIWVTAWLGAYLFFMVRGSED